MAELTQEEQKVLLTLARATVEAHVTGQSPPSPETMSPGLQLQRGAFVTLHLQEQLRGCIGTFTSQQPLWEVVRQMALHAATRDPRFPPVSADEIEALDYEISVLGEPIPVKDVEEIEIGRDGLILSRGFHRGVLLPQVATEHGWGREEFLQHTCNKAMLPLDAWRDPKTTIERFEALVFSEKELFSDSSESRSPT
jgi:uncharacterized protein